MPVAARKRLLRRPEVISSAESQMRLPLFRLGGTIEPVLDSTTGGVLSVSVARAESLVDPLSPSGNRGRDTWSSQRVREIGAPSVTTWIAGHGSTIIDHGHRCDTPSVLPRHGTPRYRFTRLGWSVIALQKTRKVLDGSGVNRRVDSIV